MRRWFLVVLAWLAAISLLFVLAPAASSFGAVARVVLAPANQSPTIFGIRLDTAAVLGILSGVVIPGVSALLAKSHWDPFWMGALTLLLSSVDGFVTEWAKAPNLAHYNWFHAALLAGLTFLLGVASNSAIWSGTRKQAALLRIGSSPGAPPAV